MQLLVAYCFSLLAFGLLGVFASGCVQGREGVSVETCEKSNMKQKTKIYNATNLKTCSTREKQATCRKMHEKPCRALGVVRCFARFVRSHLSRCLCCFRRFSSRVFAFCSILFFCTVGTFARFRQHLRLIETHRTFQGFHSLV